MTVITKQTVDDRFLLDFFRALSEPLRLRLAGRLAAGPATAAALVDELHIAPRDCLRQLRRLVDLGLVRMEGDASRGVYRLEDIRLREHAASLLDSPRSRAVAAATDDRERVLASF
ncbi:MAG: helix-turn-helix domain-containing protein, partial [Dehalococcoidia bacterium]